MKKYIDVLSIVARSNGAHIHAIVRHTGMTQPQVSALLRQLLREGYVFKENQVWFMTEKAITDLSDIVTDYSYWN